MKRFRSSIRRYFITGLLLVTPVWGTYLVLKTLLFALEGVLGRILQRYASFYVPGLGIALLITLLLVTGMLATNIFGKRIVRFWDNLLQRVPLVRGVYSLLKVIVDTISLQSKSQFNRVALIQYPRKGIYSIVFITGKAWGELQKASGKSLVNVFLPTTPNPTSGFFLLVPEEDIMPLSMTVEEAMKMVISAGIFTPRSTEGEEAPSVTNTGQLVGRPKE